MHNYIPASNEFASCQQSRPICSQQAPIVRVNSLVYDLNNYYSVTNKLVRLIALLYAARKCKQNKRYRTSAR